MKCPIHIKTDLKQAIFYGTEVNYCPKGLGVWFDKGEFRIAKDVKDKNLDWMDIDLWKEKKKLNISKEERMCPKCEVPMYQIKYGDSDVKVDICNVCEGVWLDRGEFKRIVNYLQEELSKEVMHNYTKNLIEETAEVFTGPESLEEEISDVVTVVRLFKHKLSVNYPIISKVISNLPKN